MFFFNARRNLEIPQTQTPVEGSVIAASALSAVDLLKRPKKMKKHPHFNRFLLDPQLYMASVDPALDPDTVAKLAAYPWFHGESVPKYSSGQHGTASKWKKQHEAALIAQWTRTVPTDGQSISKSATGAVDFQLCLGCEGIVLAAPLTTIVDQTLQQEIAWIQAGLQACAELQVTKPIYATIALSEAVLHVPALQNSLVHALSSYVAAVPELAGAYLVLEQTDPGLYFWDAKDPLMALLVLVDDLHRGAKKRVLINYVGTFGLVARAAGADLWSSGYFQMQRRFSLRGQTGRAFPRYHSLALAGDIGLRDDLDRINAAGLAGAVMTPTSSDASLRGALSQKKYVQDVPEWQYRMSNVPAAHAHYLQIATTTGALLDSLSPADRIEWVHSWLQNAVSLAGQLEGQKLVTASDTRHQKVWLDVFEAWRGYTGQ